MAELLERAFGVSIPHSTLFVVALIVHVAAGLTCVITGAVAASVRKRPGLHPVVGNVYYWTLGVVFLSATVMAALRWPEDAYLFFIGAFAFACGTVGYQFRHHQWRNWPYFHIPGMGLSYVALLTAFYVDNGPRLPVWNRLPHVLYWVLPSLVGVPLIVRALRSTQAYALVVLSRRSRARSRSVGTSDG
jgi:hypothetical protein